MSDPIKYDDPVWDYLLATKIQPYIEPARKFWAGIESIHVPGTGVYPITGDDVPPGFMYRMTNTPVRSPIKHVQVFPFVPVSYLNITGVAGGATKMIQRVCAGDRLKIEEFTLVEKSNLPSTYNQGQFIAIVPTDILQGARTLGKWIYCTIPEMMSVAQGIIPKTLEAKMLKQL
jgi:hypothetical protein